MAAHRRLLLAVTVLSPELPRPTHLDRAIAVCFCGRPLPRLVAFRRGDRPVRVVKCPECGWRTPKQREIERIRADADELAHHLDESLEGALR